MSKLLLAYVGLEEKYESSTRELARRAEQLRVINEVGRHILATRDLDTLLPTVVKVLWESLSCISVAIWLKDDETQQLDLAAVERGEHAEEPQDLHFHYGERSIVVWVAEHGEPVVANDVCLDPRYRGVPGSEETRAELAVPIKLEGEILGVLDIEHRETNAFEPSDTEMLLTVADQVALALQLARLWGQNRQMAIVEERNRIAREIHDGLAQNLVGIVLQLDAALQLRDVKPDKAWERVSRALDLAQEGLSDVRRSVRNLRPAPLEKRTLAQSLSDELARMQADTGVETEQYISEEMPRLPAPVEDALYRIAQEALNNVRRHAEASQVRLTLEPDGERVRLKVRDNGVGFKPGVEDSGRRTFGLKGMHERAKLLGGELEVRSRKHGGTVVEALLPASVDGESQLGGGV